MMHGEYGLEDVCISTLAIVGPNGVQGKLPVSYGRTGWEGVGQAKAVIFFIIVGVIALIQNKMTTSKEVQQ